MTLIAYRDGWMASDTAVWDDALMIDENPDKIIRTDQGWLVGTCGEAAFGDSFKAWAKAGFPAEKRPGPFKDESFLALTVDPSGETRIWNGALDSHEVRAGFTAIGAGAQYVLPLMINGWSAPDVVMWALNRLAWTRGRVVTLALAGADEFAEQAPEDARLNGFTGEMAAFDPAGFVWRDDEAAADWREVRGIK